MAERGLGDDSSCDTGRGGGRARLDAWRGWHGWVDAWPGDGGLGVDFAMPKVGRGFVWTERPASKTVGSVEAPVFSKKRGVS